MESIGDIDLIEELFGELEGVNNLEEALEAIELLDHSVGEVRRELNELSTLPRQIIPQLPLSAWGPILRIAMQPNSSYSSEGASSLRQRVAAAQEQIGVPESLTELKERLSGFSDSFGARALELPLSFWKELQRIPLSIITDSPRTSRVYWAIEKFTKGFIAQLNDLFQVTPTSESSTPTGQSSWLIRSWQENSEARSLNESWLEKSQAAMRNIIDEAELDRFLDPAISMDQLFTKVKDLGCGYFGSTSLWETHDGKQFAIKEMNSNRGNGLSDFEVGLRLDHPNIVQINNFVQKRDTDNKMRRYLLMEYINGGTLRSQELTPNEQLKVGQEMVKSARHMFEKGILPRDLHSNNLMITSDGQWKWIDLGLYQPIEVAGRYDFGTFFNELSHAFKRCLDGAAAVEMWETGHSSLDEIQSRFDKLPQFDLAMNMDGLRLLDDYCLEVGNWIDERIGSIAVAA